MSIDSTVSRRMTMVHDATPENRFEAAILPWFVAGAAIIVYLLTLNHWVSFSALLPVARTSGWLWQPNLTEPLYWLVTYPLRWLPAAAIPVALNLFAAVCGALTLALLARSVALLPHDRTKEQRIRESSAFSLLSIPAAWLPPACAAAVCGLQLTFWENATAGSIEMFNLLLFAYVIRCLLEFRIDERDSWLFRASLVYGAAMASNWAMIGFFPVFLAALIWIKGLSFLDGRFLGRMFVLGVSGLSLYLLLPAIAAAKGQDVGFWQALRANLASQKTFLMALVFNKDVLINGDRPLWVLALPSLLPILALSVRLPSFMGDISKIGLSLANLGFHLLHAALLLVCFWVALDPQFSPRHYQPLLAEYGIHLLPFYYLGALSIGYFSGYFLLVFGVTPSGRQRFRKTYPALLNNSVVFITWALALIVPVLLLVRNFPQIRLSNGPQLWQYASLLTEKLPRSNAYLLSDDPNKLLLAQSALTQAGKGKDYVLLDTSSLEWPSYYRFLKHQYGERWQITPPKDLKQIPRPNLQSTVFALAQTNVVYYLHPSFGYYFEVLYPMAHGLVYKLETYPTNSVLVPEPTPEVIAENEAFWAKADDGALRSVAAALTPSASVSRMGWLDPFERSAHLAVETNRSAIKLGRLYAQPLDFWAVQMQRHGQLPQAAAHFSRALELNPANAVAEVNLECNRLLQAGQKTSVEISKAVDDKFGHRSWEQLMREDGPFDEPTFCFAQGTAFLQGGNTHQAALQFERVRALAPDDFAARMELAQIYFFHRLPDEALQVVEETHSKGETLLANRTNAVQLLAIEAAAHLAKGDLSAAETAVKTAVSKFPRDTGLLAAATKVYMDFGRYTNALEAIEEQLAIRPDDPGALSCKGNVYLQLNAFAQAIEPLTRVLDMETNNFSKEHYLAQFMRAKAYLGQEKLEEAKVDYQVLRQALPKEFPVYFDLGEIAYREKDTNAAIENYKLYLNNAPTNFTEDIKLVGSRLAELKHGSP